MQFTFQQLPPSLTFYVNAVSADAGFTKKLKFIPVAQYEADLTYPPSQEYPLYNEDMFDGFYDEFNASAPAEADPALLEPQKVNKYGLSLQLSAEQAAVCTLNVSDAPDVNGHKLQWTQIKTSNNLSGAPDKHIRYMLSTADGIRRNFYGIKVSSSLTCAGTPQWQTLAYQPAQSWLIDISQLPGVDINQSVADFVQRYRFLNAQNLPLAPLATDNSNGDFYQRPLQQVLHNERWFAVRGRTVSVKHLTTSGEPVNKQWHTQFPALP